jgi:hypothetical protein
MSTRLFSSAVSNAFAGRSPEFKKGVDKSKENPLYDEFNFEEKLRALVIDPLKSIDQPAILIVDAVDECNNDHNGRDQLLAALHTHHSSAPLLRIFVTGRPERDIKTRAENSVGFHTFRELEGVNRDVEKYIHSRLYDDLPEGQRLTDDQRRVVVNGADGLFIWARTACDLLYDADDRQDLLEVLRGVVGLVDLYKIAMKQALPKLARMQRPILTTLGMILAAERPLSIEELKVLSPEPTVVESVVGRLGSFLVYDDRDAPIRLVHITFRDFITNRSEAGPYYVQVKFGHYTLASQCLSILGNETMQESFGENDREEPAQRQVVEILRYNY